jgi:hypothetical protein
MRKGCKGLNQLAGEGRLIVSKWWDKLQEETKNLWKKKLLESKNVAPYFVEGNEHWDNLQSKCVCLPKDVYGNIHRNIMHKSQNLGKNLKCSYTEWLNCVDAHNRLHINTKP